MVRCPRSLPLARLKGATPTKAAVVCDSTGPQLRQLGPHRAAHHRPNARHTLQPIFPGAPHGTLLDQIIPVIIQPRQFGAQPAQMNLDPLPDPSGEAIQAMLFGPCIASPWRRRARWAANSCVCASGITRRGGRMTSAKRANTWASSVSVFANWPVALAKSRTWRGLTHPHGQGRVHQALTQPWSVSSRPSPPRQSASAGPGSAARSVS